MDILYELSSLLYQDTQFLEDKDPEYVNLKHIEGRLLSQLPEELQKKLIDAQTEIEYYTLLNCFLYGLKTGFAASKLGQCQ